MSAEKLLGHASEGRLDRGGGRSHEGSLTTALLLAQSRDQEGAEDSLPGYRYTYTLYMRMNKNVHDVGKPVRCFAASSIREGERVDADSSSIS